MLDLTTRGFELSYWPRVEEKYCLTRYSPEIGVATPWITLRLSSAALVNHRQRRIPGDVPPPRALLRICSKALVIAEVTVLHASHDKIRFLANGLVVAIQELRLSLSLSISRIICLLCVCTLYSGFRILYKTPVAVLYDLDRKRPLPRALPRLSQRCCNILEADFIPGSFS